MGQVLRILAPGWGHGFKKAALVLIVGVFSAAVIALLTAVGGQNDTGLLGVPGDTLTEAGIQIRLADTNSVSAEVPADSARASAGFPRQPTREIRLGYLTTTIDKTERLVWIVNFDPSGLEFPGGPRDTGIGQTQVALAFVDATTGEFVMGFANGGPH
jgi:hypothetical protein